MGREEKKGGRAVFSLFPSSLARWIFFIIEIRMDICSTIGDDEDKKFELWFYNFDPVPS